MEAVGDGVAAGDSLSHGGAGPVDFLALRLLAATCLALVAMGGSFMEECEAAFWGKVVVFMSGGGKESAWPSTVRSRCPYLPVLAILHPCQV